jgi:hypothetical protein
VPLDANFNERDAEFSKPAAAAVVQVFKSSAASSQLLGCHIPSPRKHGHAGLDLAMW